MFVQHDQVMSEVLELKALHRRRNHVNVVAFAHNAEDEHKNGIDRIARLQAVIAALIHKNHEVSISGWRFDRWLKIRIHRVVFFTADGVRRRPGAPDRKNSSVSALWN